MESKLSHYGSIAGSVVAIITCVALIGRPHLVDFIDAEIKLYDEAKKEEDSKHAKLRTLLSSKMGIEEDEVHIEIGHQYRKEQELYKKVDSLETEIKGLKKEQKLDFYEIGLNQDDIKRLKKSNEVLRKLLDKHGLFR